MTRLSELKRWADSRARGSSVSPPATRASPQLAMPSRALEAQLEDLTNRAIAASRRGDHQTAAELNLDLANHIAESLGSDEPAWFQAMLAQAAELGMAGDPCFAAEDIADTLEWAAERLGAEHPIVQQGNDILPGWQQACAEARSVLEGLTLPRNLAYSLDGMWVNDAQPARVGVSDPVLAAYSNLLTLRWFVGEGEVVHGSYPIAQIDALDAETGRTDTIDVIAPLSGAVHRNPVLTSPRQPLGVPCRIVSEQPYGEGWIVEIAVSDPSEREALMDIEEFEDFLTMLVGQEER